MAASVLGRNLFRSLRNSSFCLLVKSRLTEGLTLTVPQSCDRFLAASIPTLLHRHERQLYTTTQLLQQEAAGMEDDVKDDENEDKALSTKEGIIRKFVDVEASIKYMKSNAFKITYGDALVWESYRRNFKGPRPRRKTRKTCIRNGVLATGNPCPICRDEYLTIHPKNVELLKQFVSPQTGQVLSYEKTGVCQKQYKNLLIAVRQAWDLGYLEMPLPNRRYNYADYYPEFKRKKHSSKMS